MVIASTVVDLLGRRAGGEHPFAGATGGEGS